MLNEVEFSKLFSKHLQLERITHHIDRPAANFIECQQNTFNYKHEVKWKRGHYLGILNLDYQNILILFFCNASSEPRKMKNFTRSMHKVGGTVNWQTFVLWGPATMKLNTCKLTYTRAVEPHE